jgi:hypothetical protein
MSKQPIKTTEIRGYVQTRFLNALEEEWFQRTMWLGSRAFNGADHPTTGVRKARYDAASTVTQELEEMVEDLTPMWPKLRETRATRLELRRKGIARAEDLLDVYGWLDALKAWRLAGGSEARGVVVLS